MIVRTADEAATEPTGRQPLVVVGARLPQSGFTRVLEEVLTRLSGDFEVHWIGIGDKEGERVERGVRRLPCNLGGGDVFGAFQARDVARRVSAPVVLLLNDPWMLRNYRVTLEKLEGVRTVAYCPVDGRIVDDGLVDDVSWVDTLVAYTAFGRAELEGSLSRLGRSPSDRGSPRLEVMPHGIDVSRFRPLPAHSNATRRRDAKRRVAPDRPQLWDRPWILNANRPTPRKRVDLSLEGFARVDIGDGCGAVLCLHHALADAEDWDAIDAQARALGIRDRVLLSPCETRVGPTDADLNMLFNACEIGLNTAMGEGWGLISFEHGATGAAQIVPASAATGELWSGAAELLPIARRYVPRYSLLEMAEVAVDDVSDALRRVLREPGRLEALSVAAAERAQSPEWLWEAVASRWLRFFKELTTQGSQVAEPAALVVGRSPEAGSS
jgi:glycosyltransferase involved in cell wall biosynthesis